MVHRPPDAAQSFNMSSNLRFSQRSPADFFMFNGTKFFVFECKSFVGNCSFERSKEDKGIIHYYQVESLNKFAKYKNVISGFLLDFRDKGNTYFLSIQDYNDLILKIDKKSFNEKDMLNYCSPTLICKRKLKVNYRYDIEGLLERLEYSYDKIYCKND